MLSYTLEDKIDLIDSISIVFGEGVLMDLNKKRVLDFTF